MRGRLIRTSCNRHPMDIREELYPILETLTDQEIDEAFAILAEKVGKDVVMDAFRASIRLGFEDEIKGIADFLTKLEDNVLEQVKDDIADENGGDVDEVTFQEVAVEAFNDTIYEFEDWLGTLAQLDMDDEVRKAVKSIGDGYARIAGKSRDYTEVLENLAADFREAAQSDDPFGELYGSE